MRRLRKRILGFRSAFATSWWRAFLLGTLPFMALTLADRLVSGYRASGVEAYEVGKGHRTERERTERLTRILPSLMGRPLHDMDVLCVGPRGGAELLLLWLYGVRWQRLTAVDLVPRHRKVGRGDMHRMPYADGSFDLIYAAFVITYGRWAEALREIRRVLRPSGLVALAWATSPEHESPTMGEALTELGTWTSTLHFQTAVIGRTTYHYLIVAP